MSNVQLNAEIVLGDNGIVLGIIKRMESIKMMESEITELDILTPHMLILQT